MPDRAASAALCIGAYTCAIAVGYGCAAVLAHTYADVSLLWVALAADVAATLAIFAFSMLADNSSVYDPYWMIGPALWLMWLKLAFGGAWHPRQTLAMSSTPHAAAQIAQWCCCFSHSSCVSILV